MKFKTFPLIGTWLFAALFLANAFRWAMFRDGWGFLTSMLLSLGMLGWILVSLCLMLIHRSKPSLWRFLITFATLCAFIPAMKLGALVREQILLTHLDFYQNAIDQLALRDRETKPGFWNEYLPNFSSVLVGDRIFVEKSEEGVFTVSFLTRDSSALGNAGLLYRSDDDATGLFREKPERGLKRIAPKWYEWSD